MPSKVKLLLLAGDFMEDYEVRQLALLFAPAHSAASSG